MAYPFRNLIFEGGGVKGIAYVGVYKELENRGILLQVERIGGTSAGAINAVLMALKFSRSEMLEILSTLNFNNFMDDSWGVIRDTNRLICEYGWYKGEFFRSWIGNLIREKTGNQYSTFYDLQQRGFLDLNLIGTNLSTGFAEVFSVEHTPRMRVVDAVRISMSIPFFFTSMRDMRKDVYVDGGVFDNYPVKLFDREKYIKTENREAHARTTAYYESENMKIAKSHPHSSRYVYNKETLGFRLDTGREIAMFRDAAQPPTREINDFFDYISALYNAIMNVQNNQHLHSDDWHRTVYINTLRVGTTDFNLPDKTKRLLVKEGEKGIQQYFEWYDKLDPNNPPINHPEVEW